MLRRLCLLASVSVMANLALADKVAEWLWRR